MTTAPISKTNLMRAAWAKFRECRGLVAFGECLRRAWRAAKYDRVMRETLASLPALKPSPVNVGAFGFRTSRLINRKAFGRTYLAA